MKVLVCGGRDFMDAKLGSRVLSDIDRVTPIDTIIHGGAKGADLIGAAWGAYHYKKVEEFPADWETHGKAAGPIRNQRMLDEGKPDLVVAFPGGKGTADMVRRAHAAGIRVRKFRIQERWEFDDEFLGMGHPD